MNLFDKKMVKLVAFTWVNLRVIVAEYKSDDGRTPSNIVASQRLSHWNAYSKGQTQ